MILSREATPLYQHSQPLRIRKAAHAFAQARFAFWIQAATSNAALRSRKRIENCEAVIRVYDEAGNVIETHEHTGDFKEW